MSARGELGPALAIAGGSAIWGLVWIPLRGLEDAGLSPAWVVFLFNVPAFIAASTLFAAHFGRSRGQFPAIILAGIFAGLGIALYSLGLMLTTVVRATMLFYLTPVWGTLFGMLWLGERPGWVRAAVLALGTLGLALLLGASPTGGDREIGLGDAVGLASGLVWALAATTLKKWNHLPITGVAFFQHMAVLMAMAAFALWLPVGGETEMRSLGAAQAALYLAPSLAILASTYAIFHAVKRMSPGRSGLMMMTEAIVAVFSASILLPEEVLTAWEWVGAAAIIMAAFVEVWAGDEPGKPVPAKQEKPAGAVNGEGGKPES